MPADPMPAAEIVVDGALVRDLLRAQHPDLADRPLTLLANGWDNVIYRLGDELLVRLPRRATAAPLVAHEQRWLPVLAPRLPLPVPAPVRLGAPGEGYPWAWTVCPWFAGDTALATPPTDRRAAATTLGGFLAALHQPAPPDAPVSDCRGIPLRAREEQLGRNLATLGSTVDGKGLRALWEELADAPGDDGPRLWLHGDVHPGNLVVHDGRLAAVVDFGDLNGGDRASDLVVAWMLFDGADRAAFRAAAGAHRPIDDATWQRARGWALALGTAIAANSADHPAYAELAARTIAAVVADAR